jgi:hypothetical protein
MTDDGERRDSESVRKYTGATKDHPLMREAIRACDDKVFAEALCDFIDAHSREPGVAGSDVIDALRITAGTLADMGWTAKE